MQTELGTLVQRADADRQDEADVNEYIRRLKSYAGAEELTRQMCLDLIEYYTVDAYQGRKAVRDIHIYYKFIDKGYTGKSDESHLGLLCSWVTNGKKNALDT